MNKVKGFFQKCRQVTLCVTLLFPKYGQGALWVVFVFLAPCLIFVIFSDCAAGLFAKELGTENKQETLKFIGFAMGGILAALGAIAVNRRADALIKNNKLIEIGHINERFKTAVEHLKDEETRIAAYYEFYSLAKQHENLRENILNILCGQLRKFTIATIYQKNHSDKPSENMQTLLDVLFKSKDRNVFDKLSANLRQTYLVGANLENANIGFADFQKATLRKVKFLNTNLQNADLQNADLQETEFRGADLRCTKFSYAKFQGTDLREADLREADLRNVNVFVKIEHVEYQITRFQDADLRKADFSNAILQHAVFSYSESQDTKFEGAKFLNTDLRDTIFLYANLQEVNLQEAYLHRANFSYAKFRDVDLQKATLWDTNLKGVDLSVVKHITSEIIKLAIINEKTQLPKGVTHPSRKKSPDDLESLSNGEPILPIKPIQPPNNPVELTEENVLRIIRDNPDIHTSAIRNALNLQEIDPKVWRTHALVEQLEIEEKIRSEKINNKRCWRIVPPTPH